MAPPPTPADGTELRAAVERCFDLIAETFRRVTAEVPAEQRLSAMGAGYVRLLADREMLQTQLRAYAEATGDDELRALVARRYHELFESVQELGGVPADHARAFLATGMLCNLGVLLDLPELVPDKLRPYLSET